MLFNQVLFLFTSQDTPILVSYSNTNGKDMISIETGSGGVMKEESIKMTTMECLL